MLSSYAYCRHDIARKRFYFQQVRKEVINYADSKGRDEDEMEDEWSLRHVIFVSPTNKQ